MTLFPDLKTIMNIGNFQVTWYAVLILSGAGIAYYLSLRQFKKWGYKEEVFENFFLLMLPIAILGARAYYVIFEWSSVYAHDPIRIFYIWEGGLAIHGGIIAATIFALWYFRRYSYSILRIADVAFPYLMIAQAIGRWGNFMNQEAYGGVVSSEFYNYFPAFIKHNMRIDGEYRQPTFLFESIANVIGFVLIMFVFKKVGRKKRGDLAFAYMAWYGMIRFFIEGLRSDSLMLGSFRIAQIVSLIAIVIGVLGILGVWHQVFKNSVLFKKQKPVVIFDLDGTLIDSKELIYKSFQHTFAKFKPDYTLSQEELQSFLGPTLQQTFARYFETQQIDEIITYYRAYNHTHHDAYVHVIPHVKETLTWLKNHAYDIAVLSNKSSDVVRMGLSKCELEPYFEVVLGSDEVEKPKPDPSGILSVCDQLHRSYDDVIYVGDAPSDVQACKRMSAYSVAFLYDQGRAEEMQKENPCAMIRDIKELVSIIKEDHEWNDVTI